MKIVFINQASGYLTIDIINEFVREFDDVALITGSVRVQDIKLDKKVKLSKIVKYNRGNNRKKAISWIIATIQLYFLLKFKYRNYEVVYFTIPPTAYLIATFIKNVFSIIIYDLYPEALKANNFNEKSFIYNFWTKMNRKIFARAYRIYTLSDNMKRLAASYSRKADIRVIHNWTAFTGYTPIPKERNSIIKREGRIGKFIVQYSGNIGFTHNVETLVEVAEFLKDEREIEFLIIGRGDKKIAIENVIKTKALTNCHILPFRDDHELYESLCVADLAVISLDNTTTDISVPSKTYNIFAAGVPIMAIASKTSSIAELINSHEVGQVFEKDQLKEMADFILNLKNNPKQRKKFASNSLKASENYTSVNAAKYLEYYRASKGCS